MLPLQSAMFQQKISSEVALPLPETVILPIANEALCLTPSSESRITLKAASQSD